MENKTRFFLEFLPRIKAAQISLSDDCPRRITFGNRSISCLGDGGRESLLCEWNEPELHLPSHLDLRLVPGEAVHVRFKTKPQGSKGEGGDFRDTFTLGSIPRKSMSVDVHRLESVPLVIRCGFCHNSLTGDGK